MKKGPNNPKFRPLFLGRSKLSSHLGKQNYSEYAKKEVKDQVTHNTVYIQHRTSWNTCSPSKSNYCPLIGSPECDWSHFIVSKLGPPGHSPSSQNIICHE